MFTSERIPPSNIPVRMARTVSCGAVSSMGGNSGSSMGALDSVTGAQATTIR